LGEKTAIALRLPSFLYITSIMNTCTNIYYTDPMIRNEETYKQVIEFRKRGFTYSEIAKICGVSKSTVSNYVSKKKFSQEVAKDNSQKAAWENKKRMQLLNKTRKAERRIHYNEMIKAAETEFKHYKHSSLFIAGLSFYMADGDHSNVSRIRVSSTKMQIHRIFVQFLRDFMGFTLDDVTFVLALYEGMNEEKEIRWWSRAIKLPIHSFGKTQFLKTTKKLHSIPSSTKKHGSGSIFIDNSLQKKKLMHWIHLLEKEL